MRCAKPIYFRHSPSVLLLVAPAERTATVTTFAGTRVKGFLGDGGAAKNAQFNQPHSLAFDAAGELKICDVLIHRFRKINQKTGHTST